MLLQSSKSLHYPITVTELLKSANDQVQRSEAIFLYSYKSRVTEGNKYGEEFAVEKILTSRFESETEGTVVRWNISVGTVIDRPGLDLVEVEEPCKHETQFGGLCAICGKDMTEVDYGTTKLNSERVSINMAHTNTALYISKDEANRIEQDARKRLLESKKLSLVVDLDQTIIQATVDPTIAEWMKDPDNPNYEAVKDVQAFRLADDGCWYYIKMRPGLLEFLKNISQLYELHIYTAGSRGYAMAIVNIVDPGGRIFGDRILSRDESGSWVFKKLKRLFPVDTKMVVIIDDRGDVWSWCKNLVKVRPYDFFVGIGDINSSFLPKREQLATEDKSLPEIAAPPTDPISSTPPGTDAVKTELDSNGISEEELQVNGQPSTLEQLVSLGGADDPADAKERSDQLDETIAAQLVDRPLLQKQKELDKEDEEANEQADLDVNNGVSNQDTELKPSTSKQRHNLLHDDDNELVYVERSLREIHRRFFNAYKQPMAAGALGGRVAELRQEKSPKKRLPEDDLLMVPDVQDIIPEMKTVVLQGVVLVFSGVIPVHVNPKRADIGRWAQNFGAVVRLDIDDQTTHVVASPSRRTAKVRRAARTRDIKIVTLAWLFDCLSQWIHVDETDYLIEVEPDSGHLPMSIDRETRELLSSEGEEDDDEGDEDEDEDEIGDIIEDSSEANPVTPSKQFVSKPSLGLQTSLTTPTNSTRHIGDGSGGGSNASGEDDLQAPHSPIDDFEEEDWAEMHAEFDDVEEDEDEESDGWQSDNSQRSDTSQREAGTSGRSKKRKRATRSATGTDDGEDTETNGPEAGFGSQLQKRKRRAFERTSSLSKVAMSNAAAQSTGHGDRTGSPLASSNLKEVDVESDDGFDADFEAELEAQLDMDDDDEA